jgi:hypothetical protein
MKINLTIVYVTVAIIVLAIFGAVEFNNYHQRVLSLEAAKNTEKQAFASIQTNITPTGDPNAIDTVDNQYGGFTMPEGEFSKLFADSGPTAAGQIWINTVEMPTIQAWYNAIHRYQLIHYDMNGQPLYLPDSKPTPPTPGQK